MTDLRYPIGPFRMEGEPNEAWRRERIVQIGETPARLRAAIAGLSPEQMDTPYRPGGWTVRQVVHHVPDSHLNAYVRLKLGLTEDEPMIRLYKEERWAELVDSRETPVEVSLTLLEAVHYRMDLLLRSMGAQDFARTFRHPEHGALPLDWLLAMYAWHGRHHAAHITSLRERMGW
jgi:hypothetical protein